MVEGSNEDEEEDEETPLDAGDANVPEEENLQEPARPPHCCF